MVLIYNKAYDEEHSESGLSLMSTHIAEGLLYVHSLYAKSGKISLISL